MTLHRSPETLTKNSLREYTRVGLHEVGKETKVSADFIFNAFQKKRNNKTHPVCVMSKSRGHVVFFCLLTLWPQKLYYIYFF